MTKPLITILTVNYNTSDYIEVMLYALRKLTKNRYRVIICDNGSNKEDILRLIKVVRCYDDTEVIFRMQSQKANIGHAEALNILIDMVDTEYAVVLDSDCTFLLKDWDELLIGDIDTKVKIIGTPLPKGRSGGKPIDFPFCFAALFETKAYKSLKISCMPADLSKGEDVCWQWRSKFINNGYDGRIFVAKNTRDFKDGPFKKVICEEYYAENTKLIATHFGRGGSGSTVKYYHKWFYNIPMISKAIRKYTAIKEKKEWMDICYKIINNQ